MKYFQKGSGEYLVLVHGALTDGSMWLPHTDSLSQYFDVVSVTLSHFDNDDNLIFGLNSHAQELCELVKKLVSDKPVNIVGWSYGADVVLNMIATSQLPLSKVFLYELGYPGCVQEDEMKTWAADAESMFEPVFNDVHQGNLSLAVESLIDGSGNCNGYFDKQPTEVKSLQLKQAYTLPLQLNQQEHPSIDAQSLSNIDLSLIFGHGDKTRDLFKLATQSDARASRHSKLVVIENESHMLPQENPEKFSSLLIDLLGKKG
ncbi:alpha/beta hydrolase [Shewanella sp. VB17]|uniref:alpha/beta fold hydrolase n=1 Tax=Shewanella sp. VB17 TaxID=2739432 RepID=UPI001563BD91|nr:alpha/beta hydrolase [Shewanella sp. VB17]NRD73699.1 alpha/beta hydrolase [Shewanella sp. VB17]